jgi:hypothetical protein
MQKNQKKKKKIIFFYSRTNRNYDKSVPMGKF